jgi:hypothetical protein
MSTPIAEEFSYIAQRLKEIEADKTKMLSDPLPDVQPIYDGNNWKPAAGYLADYDPA